MLDHNGNSHSIINLGLQCGDMEGHERTGPWSPRSNEPVVMLKLFVGGVDALQLGHDVLGSGGPGLKKTLEKRRIHRSLTGQMLTPASW